MTEFAEADLLALVEGELEPKQAAKLRRRLAGDKRMLALVERLTHDREILRAMEEPPLPSDLLTELEPMMARPMLMPDAGDWRRRYRQRRPWARYAAVAAVVCMALLAGVWAVTSAIPDSATAMQAAAPPTTDQIAAAEADLGETTSREAWPPAGSTIHHRRPVGEATQLAAKREPPGPRRGPPRDRGATPMLTSAEFVLVVNADNGSGNGAGNGGEQALQDTLQRVLAKFDGDVALVRNFSFEQAQQLARRLDADKARHLDRELVLAHADFAGIASTGPVVNGERLVRRRRAASRFARSIEQSGGELAVSGQLVGPRSLAPTYEQQLEYAEGGATWTITVPADRLNDVLAELQLSEGRTTSLRFRQDAAAGAATVADRWMSYGRILNEAAQLNGTVMLPIVIE